MTSSLNFAIIGGNESETGLMVLWRRATRIEYQKSPTARSPVRRCSAREVEPDIRRCSAGGGGNATWAARSR
jgi:hypothetical protein